MAFKNYCWAIGNTSFRVKQLNYKNELQLNYLNEFFSNHVGENWQGNSNLQSQYYDFLSEKNFKDGTANRKDKDNLRVPVELKNTGIYFETNLSSNGVIRFIRNILLECNLSHDDFIFYTEN